MESKPKATIQSEIFQWSVIVCGGALWVFCLTQLLTHQERLEAIALFAVAVVAISFVPVQITTPEMTFSHKRTLSVSLSDALTFLLLVLHGPLAAVFVGGLDGLIASRRTVKRWPSNAFTLGMIACSIFGAAQTYQALMRLQGREPYAGFAHSTTTLIIPLLVAAAVHFLINSSMLSTILGLRYRKSIWQHWKDNLLWTAVTYFPLTSAALIMYFCVQRFGWATVIAAVPVLAIIYFSYVQYNQKVEEKIRQIEQMNELHLSTVQALAMAIDAKDSTTADHVQRVKIYGRGLAQLFGLTELEAQAIEAGALLHDVGKLAVPDYILNKPGKLTPAEFEKMKIHPIVGAEILSQVKFPYPVVPVVRHHHERWDGKGYPDGLKGEEIPITARILSVVDSFDAVREDRQYRKAMTRQQAIDLLREGAGTQFDPKVVEVFIEHLPQFEALIAERKLTIQERGDKAEMHSTAASSAAESPNYTGSLTKISEAHREVLLLYEIAQSIGHSLSLRDTLTVLLARVADIVPSTTSAVLIKEKESETLRVAYAQGQHAEAFRARTTAAGSGISGWVYVNRRPMCNCDPRLDFDALKVRLETPYSTSVVVPLVKDDQAYGVLALYSAELAQYTSEHIRLLEAVARLAGDAVANALYHEEIEATAMTDRLTGLPNLRAILETFEEEANRAQRYDESFTLLMMDLDGFKQINDTYGHRVGDQYLAAIAQVIRAQLRSYDFFGRYAGDEFIALLPRTRKQESRFLLERIKTAVSDYEWQGADGVRARAGISIGEAEYPSDGTTLEELMVAADTAMYADKATRRRRLRFGALAEQVVQFPAKRSSIA